MVFRRHLVPVNAPARSHNTSVTLALACLIFLASGCATIRVTDPIRTADEEFLLTEAATRAVNQLSMDPLRGRLVWVVSEYAFSTTQPYDQSFLTNEVRSPTFENAFLIAELRARLLQAGVRLAPSRDQAEVVLEVRTGALSVNRIDFLLGIPATYIPGATATSGSASVPLALPELALFKSTRQQGFGSVAFVAYWKNSGELLAISGPFIGRTARTDYFIFGYALPPVGNIPPTQVGAAATPSNK
jgi:hypothetical protein